MKFKLIQPYNDYLINILLLLMVSLIYINNNEFKMDFNIYKERVFNWNTFSIFYITVK